MSPFIDYAWFVWPTLLLLGSLSRCTTYLRRARQVTSLIRIVIMIVLGEIQRPGPASVNALATSLDNMDD